MAHAGDLDVLTDMPAADGRCLRYDDLIGRAAVIEILGVNVHVAALEDVIASKEWVDRPKDREALTPDPGRQLLERSAASRSGGARPQKARRWA